MVRGGGLQVGSMQNLRLMKANGRERGGEASGEVATGRNTVLRGAFESRYRPKHSSFRGSWLVPAASTSCFVS